MRERRIHTSEALKTGRQLELGPEQVRHISQVLRLHKGDRITLFNGDGCDFFATIIDAEKRRIVVEITSQSEPEPEPVLPIHLGIGISKGERMDIAIQKAVELGVSSITPLVTEHCVVRLSEDRLQKRFTHWEKIAISACEQSGRRRLAVFNQNRSLEQWLQARPIGCTGIVLDHRALSTLPELKKPTGELCLLVGPEGGLSDRERKQALESGCVGVRLGPRVLRTETAPLAAISAIQTLWGDFR